MLIHKKRSAALNVKLLSIYNKLQFLKGKTVYVNYSGGKDSIAASIVLKNAGIKFQAIHHYVVKGLSFMEKEMRFYKNYFNCKINLLPHPMLFDHLRHQDWMKIEQIKYLDQYKIPRYTFEKIREESGFIDCIIAVGVKTCDSIRRRLMLKKTGIFDEKKQIIYPVYEMTHNDCFEIMRMDGYRIPEYYDWLGTSFDNITYDMIIPMKSRYPSDFELLKDMFPNIEMEVLRYEFRKIL
jgi:hypothetical protein